VLNSDIDAQIKYLEQKIDKTIDLINRLKQENQSLKEQVEELQRNNNHVVEKINFILDNISKLL
jgi:FtsZ-binding cell division protein ZapB